MDDLITAAPLRSNLPEYTVSELARALRLAGGDKQGEKRVREMETGKRDISGPVTVAVEALLRGFLPHDFKRDNEVAEAPATATVRRVQGAY